MKKLTEQRRSSWTRTSSTAPRRFHQRLAPCRSRYHKGSGTRRNVKNCKYHKDQGTLQRCRYTALQGLNQLRRRTGFHILASEYSRHDRRWSDQPLASRNMIRAFMTRGKHDESVCNRGVSRGHELLSRVASGRDPLAQAQWSNYPACRQA